MLAADNKLFAVTLDGRVYCFGPAPSRTRKPHVAPRSGGVDQTSKEWTETARKILDFLDFDWDEQVLQYPDKARQRYITTPTYQGVAQPVYSRSIGRWRNYESQIEPLRESLQPFVETFGYV